MKIRQNYDPNTSKTIADNKIDTNNKYLDSKNWENWIDKDYTMDLEELKKIFLENLHTCSQKEKFKNNIFPQNIENAMSAFDLIVENKTLPPNILFEVLTDGEE